MAGNINSQTPRSTLDGTEEFGINYGGADFKVTADAIVVRTNNFSTFIQKMQRLQLVEQATPATPPADTIELYAFDRVGRSVLRYLTPSGLEVQLAQDGIYVARNNTGSQINKGQVVYINGQQGNNRPTVALAVATSELTGNADGVAAEDIPNNSDGFIMFSGTLENIDTSAFLASDTLWVHQSTAGSFQTTKPAVPPYYPKKIATVMNSHATQGIIFISMTGIRGIVEGTNASLFTIGSTGDDLLRELAFTNSAGIMSLQGDPTTNRVLTLPDATGTLALTSQLFTSPLTTKGDIHVFSTVDTRLPVGTNGQVLSADSTEATGLKWITQAGGGDMILASAQTNTGIKTFLDTTMKLRNVANTFDGYFVNTNTADRIYTLPDSAGTVALISNIYTWTQDVDADGFDLKDLSNIEFRDSTGSPADTVPHIRFITASGLHFNVPTQESFYLKINGTTHYSFSDVSVDLHGSDLRNVGFFESNATNPSDTGVIRLGSTESLAWRNNANSGNILLSKNTSDQLLFNSLNVLVAPTLLGSAYQRIRTNAGATALEHFTEKATISFIIDGGGSAITTGKKGQLIAEFDCRIIGWTAIADQTGSIVVDVNKSTYAGFPTTSSIAGSELPTLSAVQKNQDLALSTWTQDVTEGDVLEFEVDSATTVTRVLISLKVEKKG